MAEAPELVTIYRSMDQTAKEDCETLLDVLTAEGLTPVMLDDTAPGVPSGVYEVQVPAADVARAEELVKANPLPDEVETVDDAEEMDLETIYHSEGSTTAELETLAIKNVLESNGIATVVVGDSVLPNFPFEVRVTKEHAERAKQLIAEAQAAGPAAADEAELQSERLGVEPGA
jgi:hypothetical protein